MSERRYITFQQFANYMGVGLRTARAWAAAGHFPVYKQQGVRAALVDLDEAEAAINALPPTVVRKNFGTYGPKAVVKTLPARAVVVHEDKS